MQPSLNFQVTIFYCRIMKIGWLILIVKMMMIAKSVDTAAVGATFDERQEGKVNVQIDVKDVQIVALVDSDMFEDYTNYDYAYDYADFTIKPRPTPSKPTTNTESTTLITKPSSTSSSTLNANSLNETTSKNESLSITTTSAIIVSSSTTTTAVPLNSNSSSPVIGNSTILVIPEFVANVSDVGLTTRITPTINTTSITTTEKIVISTRETSTIGEIGKPIEVDVKRPPMLPEPRKRCPAGFHLKSGRCFKSRRSVISPRFVIRKLAPGLLG